jgi:hypothetical protein
LLWNHSCCRGSRSDAELRGIDLDVPGAEPRELLDLVAQDVGHVVEELGDRGVSRVRDSRHPVEHEHRRAGNGHFDGSVGAATEVAELLGGKASLATEPSGEAIGECRDVLGPVHVIPDVLRRGELLEAGCRLGELAQEKVATHLAVGDRVDPDGLLGAIACSRRDLDSRTRAELAGILLSGVLEIPWAYRLPTLSARYRRSPLRRTAYLSLLPQSKVRVFAGDMRSRALLLFLLALLSRARFSASRSSLDAVD